MSFSRILKVLAYFIFLGFTTLCILEISFRYQLINFYKTEFKSLNREVKNPLKKVLIIGDSFSTYPNGYVDLLRVKNPTVEFINTAIPGTGIKQHRIIAAKQIKQAKPQEVIYQLYVGNDFLDIRHPVNYETLPLMRNLFWSASERFLVLHYLNYKLSGLSFNSQPAEQLQSDDFSVETYNRRVKINFTGNPNHLRNSLEMKDDFKEIYFLWKENFEAILHSLPQNTSASILVIPHCAQVSTEYKKRMELLGAKLGNTSSQLQAKLYLQIQKDFPSVRFINPLEYFREVEKAGKTLYFGNDPHLNPEGQKTLANFIQKTYFFEH